MNAENAKTELIVSHYLHLLEQACDHFTAAGDIEAFFNVDNNFDLVYAARNYPSPYGSLLVFWGVRGCLVGVQVWGKHLGKV